MNTANIGAAQPEPEARPIGEPDQEEELVPTEEVLHPLTEPLPLRVVSQAAPPGPDAHMHIDGFDCRDPSLCRFHNHGYRVSSGF